MGFTGQQNGAQQQFFYNLCSNWEVGWEAESGHSMSQLPSQPRLLQENALN